MEFAKSFSFDAADFSAKTALWFKCASGGHGFILKGVKSVLFATARFCHVRGAQKNAWYCARSTLIG
jgi:hypothetical protein